MRDLEPERLRKGSEIRKGKVRERGAFLLFSSFATKCYLLNPKGGNPSYL